MKRRKQTIDFASLPEVMALADVVKASGYSADRVRRSMRNGSLTFTAGRGPNPDLITRGAFERWMTPDLTAPRLTIDAAAGLVRRAAVQIEAAIVAGELVVASDRTVSRVDVLAWIESAG